LKSFLNVAKWPFIIFGVFILIPKTIQFLFNAHDDVGIALIVLMVSVIVWVISIVFKRAAAIMPVVNQKEDVNNEDS